jgi:hypothetical protein
MPTFLSRVKGMSLGRRQPRGSAPSTVGAGLIGTFLGGWLGRPAAAGERRARTSSSPEWECCSRFPFAYVGSRPPAPRCTCPRSSWRRSWSFLNTRTCERGLRGTSRFPRCGRPASRCRSSSTTCSATCPSPILIGKASVLTGSLPDGAAATRSWPWPLRRVSISPACGPWAGTRRACRRSWAREEGRPAVGSSRRSIEALFRVLFTYDSLWRRTCPAEGPAVVAANHPSVSRSRPPLAPGAAAHPLHAWDAALPRPPAGRVDPHVRGLPGWTPARARAVKLRAGQGARPGGEVVGLFPEGHRSRTGWMEPRLREARGR